MKAGSSVEAVSPDGGGAASVDAARDCPAPPARLSALGRRLSAGAAVSSTGVAGAGASGPSVTAASDSTGATASGASGSARATRRRQDVAGLGRCSSFCSVAASPERVRRSRRPGFDRRGVFGFHRRDRLRLAFHPVAEGAQHRREILARTAEQRGHGDGDGEAVAGDGAIRRLRASAATIARRSTDGSDPPAARGCRCGSPCCRRPGSRRRGRAPAGSQDRRERWSGRRRPAWSGRRPRRGRRASAPRRWRAGRLAPASAAPARRCDGRRSGRRGRACRRAPPDPGRGPPRRYRRGR